MPPLSTRFVSATQTFGPSFTLNPPVVGSGGPFSATAPVFAAGAVAAFTLVFRVEDALAPGSEIVNSALVQASNADTQSATASTTIGPGTVVPPIPTLSEWAMLLLVGALAAAALRTLR